VKRWSVLFLFLPTLVLAECREQKAQDFLIRAHMLASPDGFARAVDQAIRYRVEKYGKPAQARLLAEETRFFDLPVRLHRRVVPALSCVETALRAECGEHRYVPRALSGLRTRNTYRGGEISNHLFGIAIDIDPDRNPCCGCVPPWSEVPRCRRPARDPLDRADLPACWVGVFERYGFYWLGRDAMQDTMHFEFLGDPDLITQN
jgi:hypothetical protein